MLVPRISELSRFAFLDIFGLLKNARSPFQTSWHSGKVFNCSIMFFLAVSWLWPLVAVAATLVHGTHHKTTLR